ncbi:tRNA (adenosine(37)-N6)-dimethylallyltransferase MiaA [Zhihengliuella flava]|uniref:tRNA dimethylallyltransferase n=1 Tax=Zhihengliuella flava TaxID=1285193 RepID=A0A931D4W0_9MICC|nr:tRNA dimethylallyltransferase [Zhihengliuella flava]
MGDSHPPLIAVVGPTGTGKSDLALRIAEQFDGEAINADALQFYRGMDIGTAKLLPHQRRGVRHHLLDIMDVTEEASVARFQRDARKVIAEVRGRGKLPILVGGSGLYVRAAVDAIEFPPTDATVRETLEREHAAVGSAKLRDRLRAIDPESAERVSDARRVIRALEVFELTGRTFTSFMPRREYVQPTLQLGLNLERTSLHERLRRRVDGMMEAGLLEEVETLAGVGLRNSKTASRAIGYREALEVIDGDLTLAEATERTVIATRKFARRQITWFGADPRVDWLDVLAPDAAEAACSAVERFVASSD